MTHMPATPFASVILGNEPGSFPHGVLAERHPAIIRQVRDALPYGPGQHRALDELLKSCAEGTVAPLPADAPDRAAWHAWGLAEYAGQSWFDVPWLWSESYFYRRLLEAVGYFTPGPWRGIDPFRPVKRAELDAPETDRELAALDDLRDLPEPERGRALLHGSLWGNRADLGSGCPPRAPRPGSRPRAGRRRQRAAVVAAAARGRRRPGPRRGQRRP